MAVYKKGQFDITEVHCDNEFHKLMDTYSAKQDPPIKVNYASAQEHVPRAKRNNRTIKERVRATYHRLPYEQLPRIMVKALLMESTKKLNFFPNWHGVSKHYSPRMLLHQESWTTIAIASSSVANMFKPTKNPARAILTWPGH
jgi:hypothetical protein